MKVSGQTASDDASSGLTGEDLFLPLVLGPVTGLVQTDRPSGIVIGTLVGIADGGATPLVTYEGMIGAAAVAAQSVVDLHGAHIGKSVVLVFPAANSSAPIVIGAVRDRTALPLEQRPGQVEVSADGERLTVTAREQLVLRCGEASITLTRAGKVLIEGAYVSSRSSGVARVRGATVEIN